MIKVQIRSKLCTGWLACCLPLYKDGEKVAVRDTLAFSSCLSPLVPLSMHIARMDRRTDRQTAEIDREEEEEEVEEEEDDEKETERKRR